MTTRIGTKVGESGDYTITAVVETGEWGWACGYQMFGDKKYWCTWEYRTDSENNYYQGHYMMPDEETAQKDMLHRACLLRETYADAYVEVAELKRKLGALQEEYNSLKWLYDAKCEGDSI